MILKKTSYFLIGYLAVGIGGNFFEIGGKWERTTDTIHEGEGQYKDYYPINEVIYAGEDQAGDILLCVKGKAFSDRKPQRIVKHNTYRSTQFGIKLDKALLLQPVNELYTVKFFDWYKGKDAYMYAYTQEQEVKPCPDKSHLTLFAVEKVINDSQKRNYQATLATSKFYRHQDELTYLNTMGELFPVRENKTIYEFNFSQATIIINQEDIRVTSTSGYAHDIYLPPNITGSDTPLILSGGYKMYEKEFYYSELIFSVLMDIILQPINILIQLVVYVGLIMLGPA